MTSNNRPRKRCSECHKRFRPHSSAIETQKTCCRTCRLRRRARLARQRRLESIDECRLDERDRQRVCRAKRGEKEAVREGGTPAEAVVSQTTFSPTLLEIVREFTKNLDSLERGSCPVSRTILGDARAEMMRSFDGFEARLGVEVGQKDP
jgi:hypothetical protein